MAPPAAPRHEAPVPDLGAARRPARSPEAEPFCILTPREIVEDGDEGAAGIYDFPGDVAEFLTTGIARAIIDLNRAEDDRRQDGVVKTHTCWDVPVYDPFPPDDVIAQLLHRYYRPYHRRLTALAASGVRLGLDCHTMAAHGPPVGPDPGAERPWVCLSNAGGTCPAHWIEGLRESFAAEFGPRVTVNVPFRGGYITRTHAREMPWIQLELSRSPTMSNAEKQAATLGALRSWWSHEI